MCSLSPPKAGREPQALPQLETSAVISQWGYPAFPLLRIATDAIEGGFPTSPRLPNYSVSLRGLNQRIIFKKKQEGPENSITIDTAALGPFQRALWVFE